MKIIISIASFTFFVRMQCKIESITTQELELSKVLVQAVREIILDVTSFSKSSQTVNLISPGYYESQKAADFKTELLRTFSINVTNVFRHDLSGRATVLRDYRQKLVVFLVESLQDFDQHLKIISTGSFKLNGFYLVVLLNGRFLEVANIFQLSWKMQIHNIFVLYEKNQDVFVESFKPFNPNACDDTTPMVVNIFANGKFLNGFRNIFLNKMDNLYNCSVRVSMSNHSEPYVIEKVTNGRAELYGPEVNLLQTLAESLNFQINYTFIGHEGYIHANGSSDGALKALFENLADISLANWWLKPSRLKFFDATNVYGSEQIVFHVPPGRKFTAFEKLFYPFTPGAWILVILSFCFGAIVVRLVKFCPRSAQIFVLGTKTQHPVLNMVTGFIGQTQGILPKRNFARFLLAMFLMYSLVVRSLYQGSFIRLLQSNSRHKEMQTINEIIQGDYTFYAYRGSIDILGGILDRNIRFVVFRTFKPR